MFAPSIGLGGTYERPAINREIVIIAREAKQTSVDAALKVKPKTGKKRQRVHAYLLGRPATDEEIEIALNMSGNTVRCTNIVSCAINHNVLPELGQAHATQYDTPGSKQ